MKRSGTLTFGLFVIVVLAAIFWLMHGRGQTPMHLMNRAGGPGACSKKPASWEPPYSGWLPARQSNNPKHPLTWRARQDSNPRPAA